MWYCVWLLSMGVAVGLSVWCAVYLEHKKNSSFFAHDKEAERKDQ